MPQLSKNRTKNSGAELGQSLRESRDTGKTAGCSWVPAESEAGRDSLGAQTVKRLPAVQETWVQSLGWDDPLEKEMATHSIILALEIPWTEEPGRVQSTGVKKEWDMI